MKEHGVATSCVVSQVVLVVGTASDVAPAADLVAFSKRQGATVIEFKRKPSRLQLGGLVDLFVPGPAEETLPAVVRAFVDYAAHVKPHPSTLRENGPG